MLIDRRRFLQSLAFAATTPALARPGRIEPPLLGELRPDPNRILDLPAGFSYRIVSRAGDEMADGLRVPHAHDGMGAFAGRDGRVILVCNHELEHGKREEGAFADIADGLPDFVVDEIYDAGDGSTPMTGGTTTGGNRHQLRRWHDTVGQLAQLRRVRQMAWHASGHTSGKAAWLCLRGACGCDRAGQSRADPVNGQIRA